MSEKLHDLVVKQVNNIDPNGHYNEKVVKMLESEIEEEIIV